MWDFGSTNIHGGGMKQRLHELWTETRATVIAQAYIKLSTKSDLEFAGGLARGGAL